MSDLEFITIRPDSDYEEPFNFLQREDRSLMAHPMPFFSDCFEHTYQGILYTKRAYSALETFGDPEELDGEERKLYETFLASTKPEYLEREVQKAKNIIDEILAVVDPEESFGLITTDYRGEFAQNCESFSSITHLRRLFELLSQPDLFNFEKREWTPSFQELSEYYLGLKDQYIEYAEIHGDP